MINQSVFLLLFASCSLKKFNDALEMGNHFFSSGAVAFIIAHSNNFYLLPHFNSMYRNFMQNSKFLDIKLQN